MLPVTVTAQADSNAARSAQAANAKLASLRLRLRQNDTLPVVGAEVSVKSGKLERVERSDNNGMLRMDGLSEGSIEIRVRSVGLSSQQLLARVAAGENELTVHLAKSSAVLDEMRIVGNRPVVGRLEDFEMRLKRGDASAVVTQAQIDKRNPVALSTMLRGMPGLRLADSLGSTIAISTRGKNPSRMKMTDCVMRMMVDGVILPPNSNIDAYIPKDVYGVEIFNGAARIPLNMGGQRTDNWCGVIAIWTRSGND